MPRSSSLFDKKYLVTQWQFCLNQNISVEFIVHFKKPNFSSGKEKIDEVHNELEIGESVDSDLIRNKVQSKNLCSYKKDSGEMLIFLKTMEFCHCSWPDFYPNN